MPTFRSSIRLLRFAGIDLFLHWSWFLIAVYEINTQAGRYSSLAWNVAEYLSLFLIVTLHEFGHALACRQVGGTANRIVLWPFGGVAFVDPPPRPGATLWSIAAGPLVNVALIPLLFRLAYLRARVDWPRFTTCVCCCTPFWSSTSACSSSICCLSIPWMAGRFFVRCFGSCWGVPAACWSPRSWVLAVL
jgi:Zn-dependent protease